MEFGILGPLQVWSGGSEVPVRRRQQRLLLTLLLLHANEVVSRDSLIAALWGEAVPRTAGSALHGNVSQLRKLIGAERLQTRPPGYLLRADPEELDLARFERAVADARAASEPAQRSEGFRTALALWRGRPLAEFEGVTFARGELERLEELRLGVLEELVEADLELGRHGELIGELESLVAASPYRERLRGQLMLALYRSGRQAEALATYRAGRRILVEELGIDPGPDLQRLEQQILVQDASLLPVRSARSARLPEGEVAFLFTDVEGSTRLLEEYPAEYGAAIARHHNLLGVAVEAAGGVVFETVGDAVYAAFGDAAAAIEAAVAGQLALLAGEWAPLPPVGVRMAVHCGSVELRGRHYYGVPLYRCARLMATAQGGQVVVSEAAAAALPDGSLAGMSLRDLGMHRLKDLREPERVFQLVHPQLPSEFVPLRSVDVRPNNLPAEVKRFFGRGAELERLRGLLCDEEVRLVTLTGTGGSGKTRLALRAAAALLDRFRDGAFVVNLAPIADPALVAGAVAAVLGVQETAGRPLVDSLAIHLSGKELLLLIDNFEHLLEAGEVVSALLTGARTFTVLVTSRTPLRLQGEHELRVDPLPVPTKGAELSEVAAAPSVQLFVERAREISADFGLSDATGEAIAEICRQLEGLPLAVELAASRTRLLSPEAMLPRLERRLELLTAGPADLPARQRTLRDSIAWSYDLLNEPARAAYRALAVFRGGCSLEAADAVCEGDVLGALTTLSEQGLVQTRWNELGEPRFEMLDTIAEFAREQLAAAGNQDAYAKRHTSYFAGFAETVGPHLQDDGRTPWLARLDEERDNIRAALEHSIRSDEASHGLRILGALWLWFWLSFSEAETWAARLLPLPSAAAPTAARAGALFVGQVCAAGLGDMQLARRYGDEAIHLGRSIGDDRWLALALGVSATSHTHDPEPTLATGREAVEVGQRTGDPWVAAWTKLISALGALLADVDVAAAWASEAVEEFSALDDSWSRASASMSLAFARLQQGDIAAAHAALEKSVPALLAVGDRKMASGCLIARAMAARFAGDLPEAAASYKQALTLCIDAGDPANTPVCLEGLAAAVAARNPQQAAHLLAAARALFDAGYLPMAPGFENFYETTHDLLESELGTELDTLLRAGRITTLDDLSKLELSLAD